VVRSFDHLTHEQPHRVGSDVDGSICEFAVDGAKVDAPIMYRSSHA
jgi:hypothetical protein